MSLRESCAAFFIPRTRMVEIDDNSLFSLAESKLGFEDVATHELESFRIVAGKWGGLNCEIKHRQIDDYWMISFVFSFHKFINLLETIKEHPENASSDQLRLFVTDFARVCDVLDPSLALVEVTPTKDILEFVERNVETPLKDGDISYFGRKAYQLLYFGESFANELQDWQLDRPRDEVPMRKGRLFYYGSGPDRWDLL